MAASLSVNSKVVIATPFSGLTKLFSRWVTRFQCLHLFQQCTGTLAILKL